MLVTLFSFTCISLAFTLMGNTFIQSPSDGEKQEPGNGQHPGFLVGTTRLSVVLQGIFQH